MFNIKDFATTADAVIITDRDGDVAVQARFFDDEGRRVVRYSPDNCDFRPEWWWETATQKQRQAAIC